MRALVTGANGLLGSNLVRELLAQGHSVRALVRKESDVRGLEGLAIEKVFGDVRDRDSLRTAADGCEAWFQVAAVFSYWGYDLTEMRAVAEQGARNAVEVAKDAGVRRFVLTSTCAIFGGDRQRRVLDESAAPDLSTYPDYFQTKLIQERVTFARARELGVEAVAGNPALILGPHDFKPSASMPTLTAYLTMPVPLSYRGGANIVHAQDVARGQILLCEKGTPYERYALSGENLEWSQIHAIMSELVGFGKPRVQAGRRLAWLAGAAMELGAQVTGKAPPATRELAAQVGSYFWVSHAKASALGYAPRSTRHTLAETIAWLLTSPLLTERQKARLRPAPEVERARLAFAS